MTRKVNIFRLFIRYFLRIVPSTVEIHSYDFVKILEKHSKKILILYRHLFFVNKKGERQLQKMTDCYSLGIFFILFLYDILLSDALKR